MSNNRHRADIFGAYDQLRGSNATCANGFPPMKGDKVLLHAE